MCSTCRIELVSGELSPMKEPERELLARVRALGGTIRLACQAFPASSTVVVRVPAKSFADARDEK